MEYAQGKYTTVISIWAKTQKDVVNKTITGSHSLRLLHTLLTWPDILEPQFIYAVYLDDIHVKRYNSREEPPRMEHCAPWVDQEEPEYWENSTRNMPRLIDFCTDTLKEMLHIYNQSET
ncbi:hypothetical protein A6R68_09180, partial [Neotoma lepida]